MTEEVLGGKQVWIRSSGVDPDEVHVSKLKGEQVIWKSEIGQVTVKFPPGQSPFDEETFVVFATGATPSGKPKDGAAISDYKYSVWRDAEELFDPKVFIDN